MGYILLFAFGLIFLLAGGEIIVFGVKQITYKSALPPVFASAIFIGLATSLPELFASLFAASKGYNTLAVGNVLGSNISNILLIMPLAALFRPYSVSKHVSVLAYIGLLFSSGLVFIVAWGLGIIDWGVGVAFIVMYGIIMAMLLKKPSKPDSQENVKERQWGWTITGMALVAGIVCLIVGASWAIKGVYNISLWLGVPRPLSGLILLAVGTSLPELSASISSARHGKGEFIVGNILGSNIFNTLFILGFVSLFYPLYFSPPMVHAAYMTVGATAYLWAVWLLTKRMNRWMALIGLVVYVWYVLSII